jgi:micrococcal nuclease
VRTALPFVALAAAVAALLLGRSSDSHAGPLHGRVVRVTDGDTIKVRLDDGRTERVRYIGIDTPESVKPDTPVQCYAKKASHFNAALVQGRDVTLRTDAEERDRYGRLLAYVYAGGRFINRELVARGYARTLTIPPNVAHAAEFARLARHARKSGFGLWQACE